MGKTQVPADILVPTLIGICAILLYMKLSDWHIFYSLQLALEFLFTPIHKIDIALPSTPKSSEPSNITSLTDPSKPGYIQCYDPSTLQHLGQVPAMAPTDVSAAVSKAAAAQPQWSRTSFAQRRKVLRTLQKYIVNHIDEICHISSRDSGKTKVDALLGEVMTTCEKIRCINSLGELWLQKSYRPTGPMMVHKTAYVEYVPLGVLGVIAPWNYPFHNLMNHVISGLFAGNAVRFQSIQVGVRLILHK